MHVLYSSLKAFCEVFVCSLTLDGLVILRDLHEELLAHSLYLLFEQILYTLELFSSLTKSLLFQLKLEVILLSLIPEISDLSFLFVKLEG